MSLTLGQNVAASEQYEAERAKEVLQLAGFGERLNKLKKGLETVVYPEYEQDGVSFSGGEEQKIAIARAIYKGGQICILDEPTAALDPVSESRVIIPGISEPPARTLRATVPENERHIFR